MVVAAVRLLVQRAHRVAEVAGDVEHARDRVVELEECHLSRLALVSLDALLALRPLAAIIAAVSLGDSESEMNRGAIKGAVHRRWLAGIERVHAIDHRAGKRRSRHASAAVLATWYRKADVKRVSADTERHRGRVPRRQRAGAIDHSVADGLVRVDEVFQAGQLRAHLRAGVRRVSGGFGGVEGHGGERGAPVGSG